MKEPNFTPGDLIIYRKSKHSTCPGPRASNIQPARHGDYYNYTVDKFWVVQEVSDDGTLTVATRRGKTHKLRIDDPLLKRASFVERLIYRSRFTALIDQMKERTSSRSEEVAAR